MPALRPQPGDHVRPMDVGRPQHCQVHEVVEVDELRHNLLGGGQLLHPPARCEEKAAGEKGKPIKHTNNA